MTTLERIELIEQTQQEINSRLDAIQSQVISTNGFVKDLADMSLQLAGEKRELGEAYAGLAKQTAAIAGILKNKQIISANELVDQIRSDDDKEHRNIIKGLIDKGIVEATGEQVSPENLVVVSRTELNVKNPAESDLMSDYTIIDLSAPVTNRQLVADLTGRAIGETVTVQSDADFYTVFTVKEVYKHKQLEPLSE